jgi:hypothetical protein
MSPSCQAGGCCKCFSTAKCRWQLQRPPAPAPRARQDRIFCVLKCIDGTWAFTQAQYGAPCPSCIAWSYLVPGPPSTPHAQRLAHHHSRQHAPADGAFAVKTSSATSFIQSTANRSACCR